MFFDTSIRPLRKITKTQIKQKVSIISCQFLGLNLCLLGQGIHLNQNILSKTNVYHTRGRYDDIIANVDTTKLRPTIFIYILDITTPE